MAHSVHTCCQSRDVHCLGESGHFHIIVTHSDTLKRWTAVSRRPWGDHPLGRVWPLFLVNISSSCWRDSSLAGVRFDGAGYKQRRFPGLHFTESIRGHGRQGGYIQSSLFETLRSGVIIGYSDARCCYRQLGRWVLECPLQFVMGTDGLWVHSIVNRQANLVSLTHTHRHTHTHARLDLSKSVKVSYIKCNVKSIYIPLSIKYIHLKMHCVVSDAACNLQSNSWPNSSNSCVPENWNIQAPQNYT